MPIVQGFLLPFRGLLLLTKPGLKKYVMLPIIINILILGLSLFLILNQYDAIAAYLLPNPETFGDWAWIGDVLEAMIGLLLVAALLAMGFFGFTVFANLIGSPFNSRLAARIEFELTGQNPSAAELPLAKEIAEALGGELVKLKYLILRSLPILILFIIPVLNVLAAPLWLMLGLWFLALEYIDYPMGNNGLKFREQRQKLGEKQLMALAFGGAISVMLLVPILNLFAMPAAVAGAALFWVEKYRQAS